MPSTDFHPDLRRFARLAPRGLIGPRTLRLIRALSSLQPTKSHDGLEVLVLGSGVGVRLHRPIDVSQPTPALVWLHGGGYVMGTAQQDDAVCHRFARELGITVHGTFILGLPGETKETIEETIRFAREVNPHTLQVSVAAPYPGTELHRQAVENGWLPDHGDGAALVSERGTQLASLSYPHLGHTEILESVDVFYKRFYFRAGKLAEMSAELLRRPSMTTRRLREGGEFVRFLNRRARTPAEN